MRLLCVMLLGLVLCATAQAASDPVEAPDIEQRANAGSYKVYCADVLATRGAWGVAGIPYNLLFIDNEFCARLRQPFGTDNEMAVSILVLTHELTHLWWRNENEAQTECFAMFIYRWEARHNYGATEAQAQTLYDKAWRYHQAMKPEYTTGCKYLPRDPVPG